METVGLLIEFKAGRVKPANLGMATAVRKEGHTVVGLVVDASAKEAVEALGTYGVDRVIHIETGQDAGAWNPVVRAGAVAAAMEKFQISSLVGLASPDGRDVLPRIAADLDAPLVMDCIEIDIARRRAKTSQYSGKTIATLSLRGIHYIYGIRPNVIHPVPHTTSPEITSFQFSPEPAADYQVLETRTAEIGIRPLSEAEIIVSGGRGMKSGENFKLLQNLAANLGASVGASRVAVDNGWVPYAYQVGQTGAKVNPRVYIACGISGSVQHFAGMKTSGMIIAINNDPKAAIISNCDYYAVGDLFEIVPALVATLDKAKSSADG